MNKVIIVWPHWGIYAIILMDFRHYIGQLGLKQHAFGSLRQMSWPTFDWTWTVVGHETNDTLISLVFGHFVRGKFLRGTLASPQRWGIMKRALRWMPLIYSPSSRKKNSCVRKNGVVLSSPGAKSKTMNEALEAEAKSVWLCSNGCLCPENGWPGGLPMLLRISTSQETGSCFGTRDLSLNGRLLLGMHM